MSSFIPSNPEEFLELRPPLPIDHFPNIPSKWKENLRKFTCRMYLASEVLDLGTDARYTSVVLFHRYTCHYYDDPKLFQEPSSKSNSKNELNTFQQNHLGMVATACLFLGCKSMEQSRRLRDIINIAHKLDFFCHNEFSAIKAKTSTDSFIIQASPQMECPPTTNTSCISIRESEHPPELDESYWNLKENIIRMEQSVLRLLHFDFDVPVPHKFLITISRTLGLLQKWNNHPLSKLPPIISTENKSPISKQIYIKQEKTHLIVQYAWSVLNQTMFHTEMLRNDLLTLACAALFLSIKDNPQYIFGEENIKPQSSNEYITVDNEWWALYGVDTSKMMNLISLFNEYFSRSLTL